MESLQGLLFAVLRGKMYGPRILKITKMGNPILMHSAKKVENPTDPQILQIVEDMFATARDMDNCAGLSAPQVNIPLRIVLISVPKEKGEELPLRVLINPEWEPVSKEQEEDYEGCLSIPGLIGPVLRFKSIRYTFQTLDGKSHTRDVSGFHARVVQHECDHLNGTLYIMRIEDISRLAFVEEVAKYVRRQKDSNPK